MSSLGWLDRRLLFVTGKGGVGKSTVAAALGLRSARLGRRTMVAEIGGRGDIGGMFEVGPDATDARPRRPARSQTGVRLLDGGRSRTP